MKLTKNKTYHYRGQVKVIFERAMTYRGKVHYRFFDEETGTEYLIPVDKLEKYIR